MNAEQQVDVFMGSDRSSEEQPQDLSPVEVVSALDFEIKSQQDEKKALSSADDTPPPRPLADRLGVPGNSPMLNRIATSPRPRKRKRYKGIMFQGARRSKETLIGTILAVKAFKFGTKQW